MEMTLLFLLSLIFLTIFPGNALFTHEEKTAYPSWLALCPDFLANYVYRINTGIKREAKLGFLQSAFHLVWYSFYYIPIIFIYALERQIHYVAFMRLPWPLVLETQLAYRGLAGYSIYPYFMGFLLHSLAILAGHILNSQLPDISSLPEAL